MEEISPPFVSEEKRARPSSAGSIFGRRSKDRKEKERDTTSFFGRDGELGDMHPKPGVPPRSIFRGRSHSRSASSIVAPKSKQPPVPTPAIIAVPPTPNMEARHPVHSSPPLGTAATTTVTTTTTHYHLPNGDTLEGKHRSFLPPLHLPQLELTFDGNAFSPAAASRPSSSAPALPSLEARIDDLGSYSGSNNGSSEDLDSGSSSSNSTRQALQETINKSDRRQMEPIKPAPLFAGPHLERRASPPISFYNSSNSTKEMYHTHLRQESTAIAAPKAANERLPMSESLPLQNPEKPSEDLSSSPTFKLAHSTTRLPRGGWNGRGKDGRRSQSEGRVRENRRVDVEEIFREIESTKQGGRDRENRGSGFVTVGGDWSISSKRSSVQEEVRAEVGKEKCKEQIPAEVGPAPVQSLLPTAPPSPQEVSHEPERRARGGEPGLGQATIDHGFIFPFAQAVTVDEPVQLPSVAATVYRPQSNPLPPSSVDMAINDAYRDTPKALHEQEEAPRPRTAPSSGTASWNHSDPVGLGIGGVGDTARPSAAAGGFVGGWKLDNMINASRRFSREGGRPPLSPASPATPAHTSTNSTGTITSLLPRVGHVRKFSYPTIEGMALVEEGKAGNGKEVTLADMVVEEQGEQKQQCAGHRQEFRPVTIIEPHTAPGSEVVVLADGTILPAPSPPKPRSRAESPHWEPMVPMDRGKKRKSKRRWFSRSKDKHGGDHENDDGQKHWRKLAPGLSNASSSSKYSTGSSGSAGSSNPQSSISGSERSSAETMSPPGSSQSQHSLSQALAKGGGSAPDLSSGVAEFPYTSQRLAAVAAAAHPAGPPHLMGRQQQPPQAQPPQAQQPPAAVVPQTRGRTRTRESGLRYEVRGSPSPTTSTSSASPDLKGKSAIVPPQHRKHHSFSILPSPSPSDPTASTSFTAPNTSAPPSPITTIPSAKPLGKLFVVCCNCEYWHDLPSQMYYEMHERGCTVKCVYCLHGMEVRCCAGYSCAVYVLEKHHGR